MTVNTTFIEILWINRFDDEDALEIDLRHAAKQRSKCRRRWTLLNVPRFNREYQQR